MNSIRFFFIIPVLIINSPNGWASINEYRSQANDRPITQSTNIQLSEVKLDSSGIGGTGNSTTRTGGIGGTGNGIIRTGGIGGTGKSEQSGPIDQPKQSPSLPDITSIPNVPDIPEVPIDTIPEIHLPDGVDGIMSTGVFDGEVNIPDQ